MRNNNLLLFLLWTTQLKTRKDVKAAAVFVAVISSTVRSANLQRRSQRPLLPLARRGAVVPERGVSRWVRGRIGSQQTLCEHGKPAVAIMSPGGLVGEGAGPRQPGPLDLIFPLINTQRALSSQLG